MKIKLLTHQPCHSLTSRNGTKLVGVNVTLRRYKDRILAQDFPVVYHPVHDDGGRIHESLLHSLNSHILYTLNTQDSHEIYRLCL